MAAAALLERRADNTGLVWVRVLSPVSVLLAWEVGSRLGWLDPLFLPSPSLVAQTWLASIVHGSLGYDILISLKRLVLGFTFGVAAGLVVSLVMIVGRGVRDILNAVITLLYPIPKVAVLPLFLIWFGTGDATRVLMIATGAFFPVVINMLGAAKDINPTLLRAGRNLGAGDRQLLRHVVLPSLLPAFYSGAIVGGSLSLVLLVYAEMTAANSGIGYFTYTASSVFEPEKAFAGICTLAIIGWSWRRGIAALRRWHCPWQVRARS